MLVFDYIFALGKGVNILFILAVSYINAINVEAVEMKSNQ